MRNAVGGVWISSATTQYVLLNSGVVCISDSFYTGIFEYRFLILNSLMMT